MTHAYALTLRLLLVLLCRAWHPAMALHVSSATLASWTLMLLDWVATFIQRCSALRRNSITIKTAAAAFEKHIKHILPEKENLVHVLDVLSGAECAARLHACQDSPAGRGMTACPHQ